MKAAVFYGPGDLRVMERPVPQPEPGEVVLRVAACGICGTDRHIMHNEFPVVPPVIIGHEFAGQITGLGEGVSGLAPGDWVAVDPNMPCGLCRPCRRGKVHLCERLRAVGVDWDGGFAEFCVVPQSQCYRLPPSVSPLEGAMTEPLACCVRGIDQAGIRAGDVVAVIGGGAIGQLLAQLARLSGAGRVVVSDPLPERRELALALGADAALDPTRDDPLQAGGVLEGGADVVLEAVGSAATTQQAIAWAAAGGTIVWFGVTPPGETVPVEPNLIFRKELTVRGARINPFTHSRALALLASGRVQVKPLISQVITLEELPRALSAPPGRAVKVVVRP